MSPYMKDSVQPDTRSTYDSQAMLFYLDMQCNFSSQVSFQSKDRNDERLLTFWASHVSNWVISMDNEWCLHLGGKFDAL
jgi:hypothetical protein